jgi:hypothetical protein
VKINVASKIQPKTMLSCIGDTDGRGELFHNAKQIEAERQKLFKKKLQQQESDKEPQKQEARIPAPWDSQLERSSEEDVEKTGLTAPPIASEKLGTKSATSHEETRETEALSFEPGRKRDTEALLREEATKGTEGTPPQRDEDFPNSLADTEFTEGTAASVPNQMSLSTKGKILKTLNF